MKKRWVFVLALGIVILWVGYLVATGLTLGWETGAVDAGLKTCYYEVNSRLNKALTWVPTSQHGLSFGSR